MSVQFLDLAPIYIMLGLNMRLESKRAELDSTEQDIKNLCKKRANLEDEIKNLIDEETKKIAEPLIGRYFKKTEVYENGRIMLTIFKVEKVDDFRPGIGSIVGPGIFFDNHNTYHVHTTSEMQIYINDHESWEETTESEFNRYLEKLKTFHI